MFLVLPRFGRIYPGLRMVFQGLAGFAQVFHGMPLCAPRFGRICPSGSMDVLRFGRTCLCLCGSFVLFPSRRAFGTKKHAHMCIQIPKNFTNLAKRMGIHRQIRPNLGKSMEYLGKSDPKKHIARVQPYLSKCAESPGQIRANLSKSMEIAGTTSPKNEINYQTLANT